MPTISRPDGAAIYYEVHGEGFPLLLFAPGGVNSQVEFWQRSAINPIKEFSNEFMVIGMDQRNAGRSHAPLSPVSYELTVADQMAVLDDAGVEKALVMGGCIGVAYALRIAKEAPERIVAAVCQDPVGLDQLDRCVHGDVQADDRTGAHEGGPGGGGVRRGESHVRDEQRSRAICPATARRCRFPEGSAQALGG